MNAKSWPRDEGSYDEDKIDKELKKSVLKDREMKGAVLISATSKPAEEILFYNKFSNFDTIKRVIAWLKRFCHNCKVPLIQRKGITLGSIREKYWKSMGLFVYLRCFPSCSSRTSNLSLYRCTLNGIKTARQLRSVRNEIEKRRLCSRSTVGPMLQNR